MNDHLILKRTAVCDQCNPEWSKNEWYVPYKHYPSKIVTRSSGWRRRAKNHVRNSSPSEAPTSLVWFHGIPTIMTLIQDLWSLGCDYISSDLNPGYQRLQVIYSPSEWQRSTVLPPYWHQNALEGPPAIEAFFTLMNPNGNKMFGWNFGCPPTRKWKCCPLLWQRVNLSWPISMNQAAREYKQTMRSWVISVFSNTRMAWLSKFRLIMSMLQEQNNVISWLSILEWSSKPLNHDPGRPSNLRNLEAPRECSGIWGELCESSSRLLHHEDTQCGGSRKYQRWKGADARWSCLYYLIHVI